MKIVPKYAHIKISTHNTGAKKTQTKAQRLRIKNKIKFFYKKKQQLNIELYHADIQNANTWQHSWINIERSINQKLQHQMEKYTKKTTTKKRNLSKSRTQNITNENTNYPSVITPQIHILHKMKYNY
jgi:hypothetical protein